MRLSVAEEYLGTSKRNYLWHAQIVLKLQKSVLWRHHVFYCYNHYTLKLLHSDYLMHHLKADA